MLKMIALVFVFIAFYFSTKRIRPRQILICCGLIFFLSFYSGQPQFSAVSAGAAFLWWWTTTVVVFTQAPSGV